MAKHSWLPLLAALAAVSTTTVACGSASHAPRAVQVAARCRRPPAPPVAPVPALPPPADPVSVLIDTSQHHFATGQRELQIGHLERAKEEFNRALDVLLESPYGARTEPRIREHFDRLVDRISAYEVTALAEGDGFTEKPTEPASIDELLALSVFDAAGAHRRPRPHRQDRPPDDRSRHPDPAERARADLRRALPGPAPRLHRGRHEARQRSTCR